MIDRKIAAPSGKIDREIAYLSPMPLQSAGVRLLKAWVCRQIQHIE